MIDIKIPKITKEDFTDDHLYFAEEKYDGVKLTLIRNNEDWSPDVSKNWVVAYKNNVIYKTEKCYDFISNWVRDGMPFEPTESYGFSQFVSVWKMLEIFNFEIKDIPKNIEFFCEFIIRKPTLTRKYQRYGSIIMLDAQLIGGYSIRNNILNVHGYKGKLPHWLIEYCSKTLWLRRPRTFGFVHSFEEAKDLLNSESEFGGKIEGIVIRDENDKLYKMVQDDQYDKEVRAKIKKEFQLEPKKEKEYWDKIHETAKNIVDEFGGDWLERPESELFGALNQRIYYSSESEKIVHEKKHLINITDDLYLTAKIKIIKRLKGNNNALFIGKFRIFTNGHLKVLKELSEKYDNVIIGLVKDKNDAINSFKRQQILIIRNEFSNTVLVELKDGNLISAFNKKDFPNINVIACGEDRAEGYRKQLENTYDVEVKVFDRNDGISATKTIELIKSGTKEFLDFIPECLVNEIWRTNSGSKGFLKMVKELY